jgi:hypothetical protein
MRDPLTLNFSEFEQRDIPGDSCCFADECWCYGQQLAVWAGETRIYMFDCEWQPGAEYKFIIEELDGEDAACGEGIREHIKKFDSWQECIDYAKSLGLKYHPKSAIGHNLPSLKYEMIKLPEFEIDTSKYMAAFIAASNAQQTNEKEARRKLPKGTLIGRDQRHLDVKLLDNLAAERDKIAKELKKYIPSNSLRLHTYDSPTGSICIGKYELYALGCKYLPMLDFSIKCGKVWYTMTGYPRHHLLQQNVTPKTIETYIEEYRRRT